MKRLITLTAFLSVFFCFSQTDEIDRLTIELAYQKQDTTKVKTSLKLIESLLETQNYKKAILYIDQTDQLARSLNYTKGLAETNYYRALIYAIEDDYVNALDHFNKSKNLYIQIRNSLGVAKVNNNIGILEIKRGNYEAGLRNSLSAIEVFETENLQEELGRAYHNLAEAYYKTRQLDLALEYNFKALNVMSNIGDIQKIKSTTKNIGILYSIQKEHNKAIEYFEKVLAMLDPTEDNDMRTEILPRIGDEYLQLNQIDKAGQYLIEGLNLSREIDSEEGIIRALNALGYLNLKEGRVRLANTQLNEAYEIAKDSKYKTELLKNLRLHKELDSTRNYFQNAFFWQRKYYNLKEEIAKENSANSFNTDNLEGDTLLTAQTAAQPLESDSEKGQKQTQKERFLIYGLGLGLLIAITAIIFLFLQKKNSASKNIKIKEENRELKLQNDAYYEQMQHLEETNNVKDRLFSIVSHDLKDSVSSIKGFIDLLREDSLSREEFYELVPELSENANNASLLLFNLLNWSKSQMQNLESHPEVFNIQDIFKSKLRLIEQKAEEKRIVVIDESHRDFVYADKSMIEIVIQNLITNAIKFSRVGDIITVSNRDSNGKSLTIIEDTGIGISEGNLDKLFKKNNFTTIGTKNEKGTGLGLVICKELVELNNGRIWVESSKNVGTKFYVELPKSKPS